MILNSDKNYKESISILNLSVPSIIVLKYMCILDKTQWWEKLGIHTTFSEMNSLSRQNKVRLFEILINHLSLCTHIIYFCICIILFLIICWVFTMYDSNNVIKIQNEKSHNFLWSIYKRSKRVKSKSKILLKPFYWNFFLL